MGLADSAHRTVGGMSVDPYATMLGYLAMTLAYLGYIHQAWGWMDEALSEARRLRHVHTLVHVLHFANWLGWVTGLPMTHLEELLALATKHGFPFYLGCDLVSCLANIVA